MKFPKSLQSKLEARIAINALRILQPQSNLIDFASNDYLGFSRNQQIFDDTHKLLIANKWVQNGATGSRLLTGNHELYGRTEDFIKDFHQSESALIFNSGYDANIGFFNCVPQRNDIILYDEFSHASIRDGIQMSLAKAYKFKHNDLQDLENVLAKFKSQNTDFSNIYIVTESVFSMDGDSPDMVTLAQISEKHDALLIIDEAHALGVVGKKGVGLVQHFNLQEKVFARIVTFGKAMGCHGAAVLGSKRLKDYLINFSRSFIYTTGLSPHAIATILISYQKLERSNLEIEKLQENAVYFDSLLNKKTSDVFTNSSIKSLVVPGNEKVKALSKILFDAGFDVKPILSPTVPVGQERLRFCLHSYNSKPEIQQVMDLLTNFVQ